MASSSVVLVLFSHHACIGFFKEQLNVEFCNDGKITVSGQRPLFDNWWSRFRKELQAPENCNFNNMHVSFKDEVLCIVLPNFTNKAKATVKDEPTHDAEEGKKGIDAAALATRHGAVIRLRKMKLKMGRLEDELSNTRMLMGAFIVATVVSVGVGLYVHCSKTSA